MGIISCFPGGGGKKKPVLPEWQAFDSASWEDISAVCRLGKAAEYWSIGDQKTVTGNSVTGTVRIIGFDHDDVADAEAYGRAKAGLTILYVTQNWQSPMITSGTNYGENGGWSACSMRNTTLREIKRDFLGEAKDYVVGVKKIYTSWPAYDVTDELFLLSEREILGRNIYSYGEESGSRYAYFAAGNSVNLAGGNNYYTRTACKEQSSLSYPRGYVLMGSGDGMLRAMGDGTINRYYFPCFCV